MNTLCQRDRHDAIGRFDQQRDGLKGVSHDVSWFGIGFRGLVKPLDSGHLLASFAYFDAVADEHQPAIDFDFTRK